MTEVLERPVTAGSKVFPKKKCTVCDEYWQPEDRYQFARKATCSKKCASVLISRARRGRGTRHGSRVTIKCPVCGATFERAQSQVLRVATPVCSKKCNGHYRGKEWGVKKDRSSAEEEHSRAK